MKWGLFAVAVTLIAVLCSRPYAAEHAAANCTRAAVLTAYNAAAPGDTVTIPTGDCDASNQWGSYITISKANLTIEGNGEANTKIGISAQGAGFSIEADNVRVTGITFDCNFLTGASEGIVRVGASSTDPTWEYASARIDHNTFNQCGASGGDTTGKDAISSNGNVELLIDHNTFNDCNGECLDLCADGVLGLGRSNAYGGSGAGWVFIEDNTFNANRAILYENLVDGNSSHRYVFRYNTLNLTNGADQGHILSGHETCARCTGSSSTGDAGSAVIEMYSNTINVGAGSSIGALLHCRGGRCAVYDNNAVFTGDPSGRFNEGMWISNYRSTATYGTNEGGMTHGDPYATGGEEVCSTAANPRGYAEFNHYLDTRNAAHTHEGVEFDKTTLNGGINSSVTTLTLTSATGFNAAGDANGFAIRIDNEVICYAAVSGSQLTGLTRGCASTTAAAHSTGAGVDYHTLGVSLEQPNNTHIFSNKLNGVVGSELNDVLVCGAYNDCATSSPQRADIVDFTELDIQSFAQRPANWQYKQGSLSYAPYTYPHPLQGGVGAGTPRFRLRMFRAAALPIAVPVAFIATWRMTRRRGQE